MWSRIARGALVVGMVGGLLLWPGASAPARALGQDVCPEPNDTFQAACYLGPSSDAQGFLSSPNDVDAYRIEVLDFNTDVHVEMTIPLAYKVELANWNGDIIASSSRSGAAEVIDATVPIPGSYYLFVHSANGQFSDSRPYSIFRALSYPGSSIPDIIEVTDFRSDTPSGATTGSNQNADQFTEADGRYTITMANGGVADDPSQAWYVNIGPTLTDFTMTVDARVVNGVDAGFQIYFRSNGTGSDASNTYFTTIDAKDGQVRLSKKVNGELDHTDWLATKAVNTGGGVNRVVIRCYHDEILINVNGEDVFNVTDSSFNQGRFGFGAIAWEARPPVINFDNIIITTPTEG